MKRKKGFYSISVVAKMFSVHQQTVRMYEKEGLICPKRTTGNTRLFSEEDVDRLEEVINLTHKMGINLAGVEMILKLQKKIKRLQSEMNKTFEQLQDQLEEESLTGKDELKKGAEKLIEIRNTSGCRKAFDVEVESDNNIQKKTESEQGDDDWEIEYEIEE